MYKKMMLVLIVFALMIQIAVVFMYSFTEIRISEYKYLAIWIVSALAVRYFSGRIKVI